MNNLTDKTVDFILSRRVFVIAFTLLVVLASAFILPKIKIDNSVDVFFDKHKIGRAHV